MCLPDQTIVRLLPLLEADAATHHAIDEALIESVANGGRPALRFYTWTAPALSLGAAQSSAEIDLAACAAAGFTIVRRASGGTAVAFDRHLGWSLVLPSDHRLVAGDITASYARLAAPLCRALDQLGARVELILPDEARTFRPPGIATRACLAGYGPWEPRLAGRKLVGHAQVRRRGVVLYHAVAPLGGDAALLASLLAGSPEERETARQALAELVGSLDWAIGRPVIAAEVAAALTDAYQGLALQLAEDQLTAAERDRANTLVEEKYRRSEWTFRR